MFTSRAAGSLEQDHLPRMIQVVLGQADELGVRGVGAIRWQELVQPTLGETADRTPEILIQLSENLNSVAPIVRRWRRNRGQSSAGASCVLSPFRRRKTSR